MIKYLFSALLLASVIFVLSCSDKVTEPEGVKIQADTVRNLMADTGRTGEFTFFSLRENKIIPRTDSNTTKWDVAFSQTKIITNSGVRGPGQGGAIVMNNTDFASLAHVPDSTIRTEASLTDLAIPTGSDKGWYHYDAEAMVIRPIPGVVIIIRTADGKFAKMRIMSYYYGAPAEVKAEDIGRFYTFEYVYQPDGTRKF